MKKIVVLGGGESGVGAAVLAKQKGFEVFLSDQGKIKEKYKNVLLNHEISWEEGTHSESKILEAEEVIKSPGIPEKAELIQKLYEKGIKVISEIEFAARFSKAKFIGITGSNGKTTTTLLTYHMLKKAGMDVGLAGNVGQSLAMQVAEKDREYFVVELSSFQLDNVYDFKCHIAILLNITPDHLDRYDNKFENYIAAKFRITQNQTPDDYLIYCADDEMITSHLNQYAIKAKKLPFSIKNEQAEGAYIKDENLIINYKNKSIIMSIHKLALQGKHNLFNSMASGIAGKVLEIRKEIIRESLSDFQNVEHRLEFVAKINGIDFINDSKATNVNSTWYALETFQRPVIWIAGGVDKGNDYDMLKDIVSDKVKAIICLGTDNTKIINAFTGVVETIVETTSALDAVKIAYSIGKKGDTVLLSPACASFDLFENYEDRGRQFKQAVKSL
jgi:UDP-N-acetylmuramoylalanine--D-glutamate ligase